MVQRCMTIKTRTIGSPALHKQLLIGVEHVRDKDLIEAVKQTILERKPSTVGLEVPESWLMRREANLSFGLFDAIEIALSQEKIKVIPLEKDDTYALAIVAFRAARILRGDPFQEENLELSRKFHPAAFKFLFAEYQRALKLSKRYKRVAELIPLIRRVNRRREREMLATIETEKPDIALLGNAHAEALQERLSSFGYIYMFREEQEQFLDNVLAIMKGASLDQRLPGYQL